MTDPGFSTEALDAAFSPGRTVDRWLEVEQALAAACADVGLVTDAAAGEVADACAAWDGDAAALIRTGWDVGTPIAVLVDELRAVLSPEASVALHLGATTQDIIDTGLMVALGEATAAIGADLTAVVGRLGELAEAHAATPCVGRTLLQPATPTTFGLRVARWRAPLARLSDEEVARPVQLGSPTGTGADWGGHAERVRALVAADLGLAVAPPWHTDRWPVVAATRWAADLATAAEKVAADVLVLTQPEVGEVSVRTGGSSAIPGKANAIDAVRIRAAAAVCRANAGVVGATHELDRAAGAWHAEWFAVPVALGAAGAAAEALRALVESLEPDTEAMAAAAGAVPDEVVEAAAAETHRLLTP